VGAEIFRAPPDEKELASLRAAHLDYFDLVPIVPVWPENRTAVVAFLALRTQWRVGMAGRTGLDYQAIPITLDLLEIPREQHKSVFRDLRMLEAGALEEMHNSKD
jgi:hypothetical protein